MIATLVDSYLTTREEFQLTKGYQPIDSLFYVKEGSFSCEINGEAFTVRAGDVAIFDTSTPMRRHVLSHVRFLYVKLHLHRGGLFPIHAGVWEAKGERAREDLERIEALSSLHTRAGLELRNHYLNDLLLQLSEQPALSSAAEPGRFEIPRGLTEPISYLRDHLSEGVTVEQVARACGCSVSSLESKFRDLLGTSVYRFFLSLRMEEAKRLLTETRHTVTEIAARLGFDNLFYFCNAFKRSTGMTPTAYRKNNLI